MNAFVLRKGRTYFDDPVVSPPVVPPPPPPPVAPPAKVFTQAEVNAMMAEHKKTLQTQNQELVTQLETLRTNVNLTQTEKDALDARIVALTQQHLTDAQKREAEVANWKKKYDTDTANLSTEAKKWQTGFQKVIAINAITQAASAHGAANAKQLEMMLLGSVKIVEAVDSEGKPTGDYIAKLPSQITDPKTKQVVQVDLPVVEAVELMKKDATFANLFVGDGKGGIGGNNGAGPNRTTPPGELPDFKNQTPAQYRQWRAEQRKA